MSAQQAERERAPILSTALRHAIGLQVPGRAVEPQPRAQARLAGREAGRDGVTTHNGTREGMLASATRGRVEVLTPKPQLFFDLRRLHACH